MRIFTKKCGDNAVFLELLSLLKTRIVVMQKE